MFDLSHSRGDSLEVSLFGDLDINTVETFKTYVLDEYRKENDNLLIDLKGLDYIDSTGLGAFMTIYKEVTDNGHKVKVVNPKKNILKLFKITELDTLLRMED